MKIIFRIILVLVGLAVLVSLFYAEEDWRGRRAWENYKHELEAKGETPDWNAYIPAPVSDDQNFFKAPKMQEWFVNYRKPDTDELGGQLRNADTTATITNETAAINYLAWSDKFKPDFDLIHDALKRPYARMDGDYSNPIDMPTPYFTNVRLIAQTFAQRAECYLLLGQPDKALNELTLLNNSRLMLAAAPTGKPITLIAAMLNATITGLYANTIADGLQSHAWREPQLGALQKQLEGINFAPIITKSFELESAESCWTFGQMLRKFPNDPSLWQQLKNFRTVCWTWMPHGWVYQNMVVVAKIDQQIIDSVDLTNNFILPQKVDKTQREIEELSKHFRPYTYLVAMVGVPEHAKTVRFLAYNQTLVNETQIACALESYYLAHGKYPEALDALTPQFIETLPHDIIGSRPLHYRLTNDGKFLLYSVGWNEKDDGGLKVQTKAGGIDYTNGDWVWQ